ncbi:ketosteroid isomerase-like protein [Arthrobacter silviterrae]|uniref:Nuclear transport factor 2 family protein n=1 Tax=Arthrobacter silviterrae TaxID=2026658 RepID=A0ABX0DAY9_9MICC|nr:MULTISPECIES: nuclear transport factor 2 family protein [Arthrobacter]MCU6480846.1 nuclear transport factor 2 family protein [Arthrobacter sp. A2-55]MDQ0278961.1 ketosteroid isomerase-like protein [Arthrobacter silviterrae]NGN84064.1 nuclear transport factor 2 family protein [Arthrobacter silviterrae]
MDDAAVDVVRRFYTAVADRDMAAAQGCFAADALWHLPGSSPISGDHIGWAAIRDEFLAKLGPLSGGTFKAELLDVAVGEKYVVAIQHATGDFGGRILDITGCQLMRVQDGLIHAVRGHYSDQAQLDAFWEEPA